MNHNRKKGGTSAEKENERETRVEEMETVGQEVSKISEGEKEKALRRLKNGNAVASDDRM